MHIILHIWYTLKALKEGLGFRVCYTGTLRPQYIPYRYMEPWGPEQYFQHPPATLYYSIKDHKCSSKGYLGGAVLEFRGLGGLGFEVKGSGTCIFSFDLVEIYKIMSVVPAIW